MYLYNKTNISISVKDLENIKDIIDSGWVCEGKWVQKLEKYFKNTYDVKYAIPCANATSGLSISVRAAWWQGKRVALPAFTWPSTLYALQTNNCIPVWCDIKSEDDWTIALPDEDEFDCALPVDTFGMDSKVSTSKPTIYDAAHGVNLTNALGKRGAIAEVISFSFTKLVSGMQGGIILTNNKKFYKEATEWVRLSAKLLEINALLVMGSLHNHSDNCYKRNTITTNYTWYLGDLKNVRPMPFIADPSVFCLVFKNVKYREKVENTLRTKLGVGTKHYYKPLIKGLPKTDDIYSRILALPVHTDIKAIQQDIVETIRDICK